ncbi:MAG: hypothetical protein ABS95_01245 [Verrucomicrobia bacterium SCN 57-15]|nr:MAG: hypothetical protein ABS95_01245 [Verrucomicrobia bacterium SCN 57-15]
MTFKELFSLTRTNAQGKPALGFGAVLLVMGVMIGGGLYAIKVLRLPEKRDSSVKFSTPNSQSTRRGLGSPVEQPLLLKDELPDTRRRPLKNLEDLYRQREQEQATNQPAQTNPATKSANDNGGWIPKIDPRRMPSDRTPGNGKLTTALLQSSANEISNAESYHYASTLLLFTNAPEPAAKSKTNGFEIKNFLPRGHKIPIILLSRINTSVGAMPVEMAVAKDVLFNGSLQLPFGWHLIGTASQGPNHKVNVRVNTIIDPQGKEYPIHAMALSLEQEPGFDGYPLESPLMLELLPLASTTVQTFMDALKDVTTQQSIVPTGTSPIVGNQQTYVLNAKSKLLDGTAQVLSGIMADKAKELNQLYPSGSLVPRGTLGWALLTAPLDLTLGKEGGSAEFLDKDDASPTPNIITLSQQQGRSASAYNQMATATASPPSLPPGIQLPPGVQLPAAQPTTPVSTTKPLE